MERKRTCGRKASKVTAAAAALWIVLHIWTESIEEGAHYQPEYEKVELSQLMEIMEREELTEEEYGLLFYQTGLGRAAVDRLREEEREELLEVYQNAFFEEVEVECRKFNPFLSGEHLVGTSAPLLEFLQEGDILITPCSHFFGWRNGHAAIVMEVSSDREGWTLESVTLGVKSKLRPLKRWCSYPAFAVLRLGEEPSAGELAAAVAGNYFMDVPYRLTSGLWGDHTGGTQCAHLVWCCYRALGYDLDSDGGWLVTPRDLMDSPELEIVQIYGIDPKLCKNW